MREKVALTKESLKPNLRKMIALIEKRLKNAVTIMIVTLKKKMEDMIEKTDKEETGNLESEKTSLLILIPISDCITRMILISMRLLLRKKTLLSNSRSTYFWILILIQTMEENLFQKVVSLLETSL
jgi:hypothetical protein